MASMTTKTTAGKTTLNDVCLLAAEFDSPHCRPPKALR
jgi:hypothetical protein